MGFMHGLVSPHKKSANRTKARKYERTTTSASSQSIYLSYQGGGDYRGIYDVSLKRGFYGI
jgi:hypothetical protein